MDKPFPERTRRFSDLQTTYEYRTNVRFLFFYFYFFFYARKMWAREISLFETFYLPAHTGIGTDDDDDDDVHLRPPLCSGEYTRKFKKRPVPITNRPPRFLLWHYVALFYIYYYYCCCCICCVTTTIVVICVRLLFHISAWEANGIIWFVNRRD